MKRTTNSASNSRIHPTLSISTGIDSRADVVDTDNPSSTDSSLADAKIDFRVDATRKALRDVILNS